MKETFSAGVQNAELFNVKFCNESKTDLRTQANKVFSSLYLSQGKEVTNLNGNK
jgi:hypothetical protein